MRKTLRLAAIAPTLALGFCLHGSARAAGAEAQGSGATASRQPVQPQDRAFIDYAAEDNQAEIRLCLVAEKQARSPAVKAFARLMVDDHVEIESRLAAIVNGLGVETPNGPGKEGADTIARLEKLDGAQFDREFLKAQVKDHSSDIGKFGEELRSTHNDALHSFASETVGILKQHLALAQAVQSGS